jgi:hypothetical protein
MFVFSVFSGEVVAGPLFVSSKVGFWYGLWLAVLLGSCWASLALRFSLFRAHTGWNDTSGDKSVQDGTKNQNTTANFMMGEPTLKKPLSYRGRLDPEVLSCLRNVQ